MSKDRKEDRSEFTFIKEQIVSSRKSKARKVAVSVSSTLGLAVIFGVVARVAFSVSEPLVDKILGLDSEKKPVTIISAGSGESAAAGSTNPTKDTSSELNTTVSPEITQGATAESTIVPAEGQKEESMEDSDQVVNNFYIQNKIHADLDDYNSIYSALHKVTEEAMDSLVTVTGVENGTDLLGSDYEIDEQVPGLIVGENGVEYLILTSYIELKDTSHIRVTFNKQQKVEGKLTSYDKDTNLAIVSVPTKVLSKDAMKQIKVAQLGESYGVRVGTPVLAIGSPNGICNSISIGMITNDSVNAYVTDRSLSMFYLDIPSVEKSHGYILNTKGNVIGIISHDFNQTVTTLDTSVLGISKVKSLIQDLMNEKERVYAGILAQDMPQEALEEAGIEKGIYVVEVSAKSPAYEAGIQSGDIILAVDDTLVGNVSTFRNFIDSKEIKTEVKITIRRTTNGVGEEKVLPVVLGKKNH